MPVPALYAALAVVAALENVFPPVPADTVVAFGSFLAARGQGTAMGVFLCTWSGNIAGAMLIYALGRRYGAERLERRLLGDRAADAEFRLRALYGRYGLAALFVSRFLPGVRAIVPPLAGALRVPAFRTAVAMGAASAVWYGAISYLAFRIGADWDQLAGAVGRYGRASERTSEAYLRDVERLVTFAVVKGAPAPVDLTARLLRTYVYHLKDLGLAPASIRRNVSAARTYFRFLLADGHVVRDPTERLETPKRWRTLPEVLTVGEVKALLEAPTVDDPLYFRDRALLEA